MTHQFAKHFTPAEARNTLPLVRRIVQDILNRMHEVRSLATMLGEDARDHPQMRGLVVELEAYMAELEAVGCFFKDWDFSIGLVDFPALIENREVFLCWRSDEQDILYYHGIDDGFTGRRRIPDEARA